MLTTIKAPVAAAALAAASSPSRCARSCDPAGASRTGTATVQPSTSVAVVRAPAPRSTRGLSRSASKAAMLCALAPFPPPTTPNIASKSPGVMSSCARDSKSAIVVSPERVNSEHGIYFEAITMDVVAGTGTNQRPDLSDAVADFIADTDYEALPPPVVERVKKSILDVVGVGVYGSPRHEVAAVLAYAKHHAERKESTIFCGGGMASSFQTAMVNGSYVHTTEFAEGFSRALVHPGNSIIPGLLAVCERDHRSGKDLLTGASLGYELNIRMGRTVEAEFNLEQGFHVPAVLGAIASAAACGKALGLDREGIVNVLGISSCQMPNALMAAPYEQPTVKDLFQGFNSALGVLAADFAVEGITGLHDW